MSSMREMYDKMPNGAKKVAKNIYDLKDYIPFSKANKKRKWISNEYFKFGQDKRREIFLSCARFCHINGPVTGYYFEFGSHEANTMRMAWDHFHWLFDWKYVSFDSFEGLPEIEDIDKQQIWEKGRLKTEEENFVKIVTGHGMPKDKLITVKGFYDQTLNDRTKTKFLPGKAAVIYIDCDLYMSTVPILEFIKDFLQQGTIIIFDDWNCFYGSPEKGERLAFKEFREKYPNLLFEEFVKTNEAMSFIFVGEK